MGMVQDRRPFVNYGKPEPRNLGCPENMKDLGQQQHWICRSIY